MSLETVNTKLKALKLITDPSLLLSLLFSKYGNIQEDLNVKIANQLILNKAHHLNIYFKEQNIFNDKNENLRRFYQKNESFLKIKKLNDYYKNYQSFFCKAIFADFFFANTLKNYQDKKAEIFYKENYGNSSENKEEDKSKILTNSSSLTSLDNITYNKTIFNKKYKNIIENEDSNKSLILTVDSFLDIKKENEGKLSDKGNLISINTSNSTNEKDKSFIDCLKYFIYYKKVKEEKENNIDYNNENNKNNILFNSLKKSNDKIKNKLLGKKEDLYKSNKENKNYQNLISKTNFSNKTNTQLSRNNNNTNNNKDNLEKMRDKKIEIENKELNTINLILSPTQKNSNFANLTSRKIEIKKLKPINKKSIKKNKNHFNNNKKHNQIISRNISQNSNISISFPYPKKNNEFSTKILNDISLKKLKHSSNKNIQAIQSNFLQFSKYNQFLKGKNKLMNNRKNKTFELINNGNKIQNLSNKNNIFNKLNKLTNTHNQNNNIENNNNNYLKSKFNLFKNESLSPINLNPINRNRNKNGLNNFQAYNQLINKSRNFDHLKKYMISSKSIDNNIHISSFSPKSISQNLKVNKEKNNILNDIKIIKKLKFPNRLNKNHIKDIINNNNYNINFNNLFFYGLNTPNYFDKIKNNIINNQNRNANMNIKKINSNFYMLSLINLNSSNQFNARNKTKINDTNYPNSKIKNIMNDNINIKHLRKCQSQKEYTNHKRKDLI